MSVSKWAYNPEKCDGDYCPGDCDGCPKVHLSPLYVEVERHKNCTVQVLKNIITGELSVGWWEETDEDST